jgi:hypothetical protein
MLFLTASRPVKAFLALLPWKLAILQQKRSFLTENVDGIISAAQGTVIPLAREACVWLR